nr:hypothetical protein Iba_chr05bCG3510 [Ipomoea batatas]
MVGISVNISLLASTMLYSKGRNYYHYSWALIVVLYEQSCIKEAGFHVVVRVSTYRVGAWLALHLMHALVEAEDVLVHFPGVKTMFAFLFISLNPKPKSPSRPCP